MDTVGEMHQFETASGTVPDSQEVFTTIDMKEVDALKAGQTAVFDIEAELLVAPLSASCVSVTTAGLDAVEGYKYSDAMLAANLIWDEATFKELLRKPKAPVPKTKMELGGLKKEKADRRFGCLSAVRLKRVSLIQALRYMQCAYQTY